MLDIERIIELIDTYSLAMTVDVDRIAGLIDYYSIAATTR